LEKLMATTDTTTADTTSSAKTTTRTKPTSKELLAKVEKAKAALKALESRAYAEELDSLIAKHKIVDVYNEIRKEAPDVSNIEILSAIGRACGIQRLDITQKDAVKRVAKKT
jgi:hypothetical protein